MRERQVSSTAHPIEFLLTLSSDHVAGATGLVPTVTISKDGGAFAAPAGAVTEVAFGWYALAGNAADRNTLGALLLHATAAGCDPADAQYTIVGYDPFDGQRLGLGALPAAGGLAATTGDAYARIGANGAGLTALGDARLAHLDADVSSRSTYAGADTAGTGTLLARLDAGRAANLDNLDAAVSTRSTYAGGDVTLAAAQPNYAPARAGDAMTLTAAYDAARTANAVAPDNAGIAAIRADYQQRGVAVTLPAPPPGYGGAASAVAVDPQGRVVLQPDEHALVQSDVASALAAGGYNAPRAAKLDRLDAAISSIAFPADYQRRGEPVTLPASAPPGYGATPDAHTLAVIRGDVVESDVDGSNTFYDVATRGVARVRFDPRESPGGRKVTLDP